MIITCTNCNKKFEVNSALIPDGGRLLQCSACNYEWFYKEKFSEDTVKKDDYVKKTNLDETFIKKKDEINIENILINPDLISERDLKKENLKNEISKSKSFTKINTSKNKVKRINILNLTIIFIISFIALIILIDTFKTPISLLIPNIELILYNLYETFKDVTLFIKDLL